MTLTTPMNLLFHHRRFFVMVLAGVLTTAAHAQELTVTNGLQLWLRADAGVTAEANQVSAWADQSPAGNNASQTDPGWTPTLVPDALNGKPVLRFDGEDDFLEIPDSESLSGADDLTTFFVVKFDDFVGYQTVWAKTVVNLPGPTDFYLLPGSGAPRVYRGNGTDQNLGFLDGPALRSQTYLIVGFDSSDGTVSHYLSGQATATSPLTAETADGDASLLIGTRGDFFTKLKGDLAELVIYDRALTPTERAALVDYLATKYNIQNLPPTVSFTANPAGPNVAVGDIVTLTATAADPDGRIARLDFLANGSVVATASAPPYSARIRFDTAGTFDFTARAVDDKDAVANSTTNSFTAGPATTPSMTATNGLRLWLAADAGLTSGAGGVVTGWADQSGSGNHAVQSDETLAPTLVTDAVNGHPALHFDGLDDYLDVPDSETLSIAGDITSLFVVRVEDFATYRSVWGKTLGNLPAATDYYLLPGSGIPRLYRGNAEGSLGFSDGTALRAGAFELAGFSSRDGATAHYLNGRTTGTGAINATLADRDTPLKIGSRDDFVTRLQGDLAELLIFDTALSEGDLQSAQLYLAGKYGIGIVSLTNEPPQVTLTSPSPGAVFSSPTNITVEATATDADGGIARVEFLWNGAVVAVATNAPYTASLSFATADESTLRVRATDNLSAVTVSAPVSIRVTSTSTIALPSPARLKLWLRADAGVITSGGAVSTWEDQSGNLNHAVQALADNQPQSEDNAINNKPALRFDGENDSLAIPHSLSLAMVEELTSFFVVSVDDFETFRAVWAKTDGNQPRPTDYYFVADSGNPRLTRGGTGVGSVDGTTALAAGEYAIVGFDVAGPLVHHYLNGGLNGEGSISAGPVDAGKPLQIGTRDDQGTRLRGSLAELIIYNSVLSAADRSAVLAYLSDKYGIPVEAGPPSLAAARSGGNVTISWPAAVTGYTLETTDRIPGGNWQPVPGVANNSVTVPIGPGAAYFRLVQQ